MKEITRVEQIDVPEEIFLDHEFNEVDEKNAVLKLRKDENGLVRYIRFDDFTARVNNPFETDVRKNLIWKRVKKSIYDDYLLFLKTKNVARLMKIEKDMI